jgi:hypothetical protein
VDERWLPVQDFPGYEVSDSGNVRSWKNFHGGLASAPRLLRFKHRDGYPSVDLVRNGKPFSKNVHSLVMESFVGPRHDGMVACHSNGVRTDNRLSNLRYDTHAANHADKRLHENDLSGERNPIAKLNNQLVVCIRVAAAAGEKQSAIALRLGVSETTISGVIKGRSWKHVGRAS